MTDHSSREALDRLRRIETRLIRFMKAQGFDVETKLPEFIGGVVHIPSIAVALKDILSAVPHEYTGTVIVLHQGEEVATLVPLLRR